MKPTTPLHPFKNLCAAVTLAALTTFTARAQITWSTAQNITADSDVVTAGTQLYAYDFNNAGGGSQTVNGVAFSPVNLANPGHLGFLTLTGNNAAETISQAPFNTLSMVYSNVLIGQAYVSSSALQTVTFSNLISGHSYLVQFWVGDPRTGANGSRTDTLSSPGGNSVTLKFAQVSGGGYPGQFAVGIFTAPGATQPMTVVGTTGSVPAMNAVQVRDVTGLGDWGGYENSSWDETSTNWGTGQSFTELSDVFASMSAYFNASVFAGIYFADTDGFGNAVTASTVSVQPAGVSIGAVNFVNNTVNYTLQSDPGTPGISGATAVNVLGSGTVTFTGPNTYTGATTIGSGTLALSGGSISNSPIILNGGSLNVTAVGSFDLGGSQPVVFNGGTLLANGLTLDGAVLTFSPGAQTPSITTTTLTYGSASSLAVAPPRFSSYPVQYPLISYTSIGGGAFNLNVSLHLFIDAWPCGWMKTIMDVHRIPKQAYFAYRDALTPLMVSLRTDRRTFFGGETVEMEAWVCNDTHEVPAGAQLRYHLEIGNKVIHSGRAPASVPRCSSTAQGKLRFMLPQLTRRTTATVRLALAGKSGKILFDTTQEVEVFPALPKMSAQRVFIIGHRNGLATTLAKELGFACVHKGIPQATDVIVVDDPATYARQPSAVDAAVQAGATAVFLELPPGKHVLSGDELTVVPGGMGQRHFVSCSTGHELVADFQPYDCWFWHDTSVGYPTPLLATVLDPAPAGWATVLASGNGSWATAWKPVPAAVEKRVSQGMIRVCQVKLAQRTATNPSAAIFARRLLGAGPASITGRI